MLPGEPKRLSPFATLLFPRLNTDRPSWCELRATSRTEEALDGLCRRVVRCNGRITVVWNGTEEAVARVTRSHRIDRRAFFNRWLHSCDLLPPPPTSLALPPPSLTEQHRALALRDPVVLSSPGE